MTQDQEEKNLALSTRSGTQQNYEGDVLFKEKIRTQ